MKNNIENFKIRLAALNDSYSIWEIRNHPSVCRFSNNNQEIPLAEHMLWFEKKYFSGQDNYCFVMISEKNNPIGYCRFDFDGVKNRYIISIAIDSDFQGKGLGNNLLAGALRLFDKNKEIFAEILKDNVASVKLFKNNNFIVRNEDKKNYYLKFERKNMQDN